MAYGDIPDLIFTTDSDGNVIYTSGSNSGNNTPTTGTGTTTGGTTTKKWWESVIGIIPGLATAIFGQQSTSPVYQQGYPYPTQSPATASNSTMIMIAIAVVVVLVLVMNKK